MPCVLAGADCVETRAGAGEVAVVREALPTVAAEAAEAVAGDTAGGCAGRGDAMIALARS